MSPPRNKLAAWPVVTACRGWSVARLRSIGGPWRVLVPESREHRQLKNSHRGCIVAVRSVDRELQWLIAHEQAAMAEIAAPYRGEVLERRRSIVAKHAARRQRDVPGGGAGAYNVRMGQTRIPPSKRSVSMLGITSGRTAQPL